MCRMVRDSVERAVAGWASSRRRVLWTATRWSATTKQASGSTFWHPKSIWVMDSRKPMSLPKTGILTSTRTAKTSQRRPTTVCPSSKTSADPFASPSWSGQAATQWVGWPRVTTRTPPAWWKSWSSKTLCYRMTNWSPSNLKSKEKRSKWKPSSTHSQPTCCGGRCWTRGKRTSRSWRRTFSCRRFRTKRRGWPSLRRIRCRPRGSTKLPSSRLSQSHRCSRSGCRLRTSKQLRMTWMGNGLPGRRNWVVHTGRVGRATTSTTAEA